MEVQYFCRLRPLGEYFIGGEKTFDFGGSKGSAKSNYFIHSEEEISQATILRKMTCSVMDGMIKAKRNSRKRSLEQMVSRLTAVRKLMITVNSKIFRRYLCMKGTNCYCMLH